jgi:hypothetical protein
VRVQTVIQTGLRSVGSQTLGVRVMLLTDSADGPTAQRLIGYRSQVDLSDDLDDALSLILEDPLGYDLFVMDCDGFGGVPAAERAIATLIAAKARMRVMLISREFDTPAYPMGRRTAVCLPDDVADASFRIGFDHVLRDWVPVILN